jgi:hypothetical protein
LLATVGVFVVLTTVFLFPIPVLELIFLLFPLGGSTVNIVGKGGVVKGSSVIAFASADGLVSNGFDSCDKAVNLAASNVLGGDAPFGLGVQGCISGRTAQQGGGILHPNDNRVWDVRVRLLGDAALVINKSCEPTELQFPNRRTRVGGGYCQLVSLR